MLGGGIRFGSRGWMTAIDSGREDCERPHTQLRRVGHPVVEEQ